jgi:hypothetical protein
MMVEVLVKVSARRCYGAPGDTLNYFTDAVGRFDLRWVHVRHEEAGAMAAGADALLTGELALCAGSCGPRSLHFINGVWGRQHQGGIIRGKDRRSVTPVPRILLCPGQSTSKANAFRNAAFDGAVRPVWVKTRRAQSEQMSSAVP